MPGVPQIYTDVPWIYTRCSMDIYQVFHGYISGVSRIYISCLFDIVRVIEETLRASGRALFFYFFGKLFQILRMGESDHYGFSLTTFSPSGKLMQIEYALNAVKNGQPSVGLRASDGVVLATENKISILYEDQPKVEKISQHIGCVYSGMGPDYRILVKKARKLAMEYELMYGEEIPTTQLVTKLAAVMQEYTQSGGVRPFGVSMLVAGWDHEPNPGRPLLFQCDPSGAYFAWKATALGKNDVNAKTFLEKRFSDALELDDGIHTALLTLRESFDVGMTEDNVEIAVCNKNGFMRLSKQQVKDHLDQIHYGFRETGKNIFHNA
ncbi:Proteasome subunit [Dirofilaria immitis]